jgi:hypothetical protein
MNRLPLMLALTVPVIALVACSDDSSPTQPDRQPVATPPSPAFAVGSNTWTPKAGYANQWGPAAVEVTISPGHSLVYVLGGIVERDAAMDASAYDLATNTWTQKKSFFDGFNSNGAVKIGTLVYYTGGWLSSDESLAHDHLFVYNPLTDVRTDGAHVPLHTAEGVSGAVNGKLYVLPGACSGDGYPFPGFCATEPIRTLFRYDPATNTWSTRRSCPHYHRGGGGGVIDGKFYVVGGGQNYGGATTTLDVYDAATNTWATRAPMPTAGSLVRGTVIQNKLFVVLYTTRGTLKAYRYNPLTNVWTARGAPPTFGALARIQLNGNASVLSVGGDGQITDQPPPASQLYTP